MSKGLEIINLYESSNYLNTFHSNFINDLQIVKQELQRLESIDNSNPSEALEELERDIKGRVILAEDKQLKLCAVIKQALLQTQNLEKENTELKKKAQEHKKAIEIITEKAVNMLSLKFAIEKNSLELYNNSIPETFKYLWLTQEEFDLLKRWRECQ